MNPNNVEFLTKLRLKDSTAIECVVRLYTKHLYNACLALGFKDFEADDVTQSVWITFFDVIPKFEGKSSVRTYLFGILYNKASEYRKQNNRADATEKIDEIVDSHFDSRGHWILSESPVSPDKFLESAQTISLISRCLESLPINQKMAFILKEIEEELTDKICNILSVSATNLGVLLFRARNQLRECVDSKSR